MRKFTLLFSALALSAFTLQAQTVATFDDLTLPGSDTCYVNYSHPGMDVGFNDGLAYFPCVYDTSYGGTWEYGFSYSNKSDTITSGYTNEYSSKTGSGYGGTGKYAVAFCANDSSYISPYIYSMNLPLTGIAIGEPVEGFYITNGTYAYNTMRDGGYPARKFGDTTGTGYTASGTYPDWFALTIKGYLGGALLPDSVVFYLADYRFAHTDSNYIVKTWDWVNLLPLGHVDSLQFSLNSSDTFGGYGMNTPAYFCMDNFTTHESSLSVTSANTVSAKVHPNPATNTLYIDCAGNTINKLVIFDIIGNVVYSQNVGFQHIEVNTSSYPPGLYEVQLSGENGVAQIKFVKE